MRVSQSQQLFQKILDFFGGRAHKKGAKIKSSLRRKQFAVDIGLVDGDELQLRSVLDVNFVVVLFIVHVPQVYYTGSGRNEDAEFCLTVYLMSLYKRALHISFFVEVHSFKWSCVLYHKVIHVIAYTAVEDEIGLTGVFCNHIGYSNVFLVGAIFPEMFVKRLSTMCKAVFQ